MSILAVKTISRIYHHHGVETRAVDNISAEFKSGEMTVIFGASGSGKSTLLLMLGGMMKPSKGVVEYNGKSIYSFSSGNRKKYRSLDVGFIFQKFFLMPYLSVKDNILLSVAGKTDGNLNLEELAKRFGVEDKLRRKPAELSVGEQQRVALMRALVRNPAIILADEPTGNLDSANTDIVAQTLREEASKGRIVIMVTHNRDLANSTDKTLILSQGKCK
jgi:putative ABC transport system ATP-binding protein